MKASILLPVYNVENYVITALESVRLQRGFPLGDLEVIVVNDGSTDSTLDTVKDYVGRNINLKIQIAEHSRNKGAAAARNTASQIASGDFLVMLDGDDILNQGALNRCATIYENHLDIGFVYSDYAQVKAETGPIPKPEDITHIARNGPFDLQAYLRGEIPHVGHIKTVRASMNVPFDETLTSAEDTKWFLTLAAKGVKFHHVPEILYYWRRGISSLCSSRLTQDERDKNHRRALADTFKLLGGNGKNDK